MALEGYSDNDAKTYKGNDIDTDGDGKVDSAASADDATTLDGNSVAQVQNHAPNAHATSHKNGGSDELDPADQPSSGNANEVLTSDGAGAASWAAPGLAPLFGDGSDGAITRSSNGNENGLIWATTYEIESGVTRTVSNGVVVIHATESITIDGTLDAKGVIDGGSGGDAVGANNDGNPGGNGTSSDLFNTSGSGGTANSSSPDPGGPGAGGAGGTEFDASGFVGGDGGDAGGESANQYTSAEINLFRQALTASWDSIYDLTIVGGCGGGGGGSCGIDGSFNSGSGAGGSGGGGGGVVVLISPSITITGDIIAAGEDGQNGSPNNSGNGGGGGGGGGSGGLIIILTSNLSNSGTVDVSGGVGGSGAGDGTSSGVAGGDGGNGTSGLVITPP